ncbi:MAG: Formiminotransferase-cyclodeaminase [Firmicutes bacterium]|nr:Formiminotransferase-cyclodeaminase [Bacillota bacterium]
MSKFFDKSFREILEAAASSSPTPGGGGIAGVVAALGASMTAMVANLTIGKDKYKSVEPEVQAMLATTNQLIDKLEALVDADMTAFSQLMDAYRLPKTTPEEKDFRDATLETAVKHACDTPLDIARVCLSLLEVTAKLAPIGNKMAVSDAGVASVVAEAALNSVLLSVDINLPLLTDKTYIETAINEKNMLKAKAKAIKEKTLYIVNERM